MKARACIGPLAAALSAACSGADPGALLRGPPAVEAGSDLADAGAAFDATVAIDGGVGLDATLASPDTQRGADPDGKAATPEAGDVTADAGDAAKADVGIPIAPLPSLHVVGNRIYDNAIPIALAGVHRAGTEYSCVHGVGIFDGPSDVASIQAIKTWSRINAVRVPLNEDCWLGINGAPAQYSGANYQSAISNYVTLLLENGLYPILDLHWSAAGSELALAQAPMPDQDHSPAFWSQVATMFKGNLGVVFDLFSEPNPANGQETAEAWACWRDGTTAVDAGSCSGIGYAAAGMQSLLTAVRAAGANNLVLLAGVVAANALSQWSVYKPDDPAGNVAAAWHLYNDRACSTTSCFDTKVAPIAQSYPVVATEIGEKDCLGTFITTAMDWLDARQQGYVALTWDTWTGNCLSLISDYTATPTNPYGLTYKTHLPAPLDAGGD